MCFAYLQASKLREYSGAVCSGVVLQVLFHPKQLMLVTSGDDSDVRVWDLVSKSCVAVLKVLLTAVPHQKEHPAVCHLLIAHDLELSASWYTIDTQDTKA